MVLLDSGTSLIVESRLLDEFWSKLIAVGKLVFVVDGCIVLMMDY